MNKQKRIDILYSQIHKTENDVEYKKCRQCGEWKPLSRDYFRKGSNKQKDGFQAICKICSLNKEGRIPKEKGFNKYEIRGDITVIFIDNGVGEIYECFIDTEDLPKLIDLNYRWCTRWYKNPATYYVSTNIRLDDGKVKTILLHRLLMNVDVRNEHVHHEIHDGLFNLKSNLRITTNSKNNQHRRGKNCNNKSGYRNVFWNSWIEKWTVNLMVNYESIHIGDYEDVDEAGRVAEDARQKYYGEYAGKGD